MSFFGKTFFNEKRVVQLTLCEAASLSEEDRTVCVNFKVILDAKCSVDFEESAFYFVVALFVGY